MSTVETPVDIKQQFVQKQNTAEPLMDTSIETRKTPKQRRISIGNMKRMEAKNGENRKMQLRDKISFFMGSLEITDEE